MRATSIDRPALAVLLAVTAMLHSGCGGGGGRIFRTPDPAAPAASDPARSALEGEWTLVGLETASGPRRVSGFLRYDRFANISVHAELTADDPGARPPRLVVADFTAKASPESGQLDFVGLQTGVDADRLAQDAAPMGEWQQYQLDGDTLRLSVRGGGATLVFRRAR
ncbi:MAG: hypothetical protein AB7H93_01350 [Vicinamibacterales bacterium]